MSEERERMYSLAIGYKQVIRDFLGGGVDELFSFVQDNPKLVTHPSIRGRAKEMLRKAIRQQQADAEAFRGLVKMAREAGVPLFNPAKKEGDRRNGTRAEFNGGVDTNIDLRPQPAQERRGA